MLFEKIVGVVLLLLALWQFYAAYSNFRNVQRYGNKHTSPFIAYANFYGWFFGALLIVMGMGLLTHAF
ncbi:immunity protein [Lacticaseibacillus jixiensis]|uniref:immunity protein n=1 Tax=Lacticaseibacillus jixiensis TaxID=3231926 RepID=UPI0036F41F9B